MCVSLPPTGFLGGTDYYVPPISSRKDAGAYHIRVVAAMDSTVVLDLMAADTQFVVLNCGEHHEFKPVTYSHPERAIRRSRPCLVAQYNTEPEYVNTQYSGPFLMWIPSINFKTKYVKFVTPHNEFDQAMHNTLAIVTWFAITDEVYLDGVTLTGWTEFWSGSEMAFLTVTVNDGNHEIIYDGTDGFGLLAWLYGYDYRDYDAYGTVIGFEVSKYNHSIPNTSVKNITTAILVWYFKACI